MKAGKIIRKRRGQAGIALLIAIFILLLISVVAIALVVSSGTETALAGNYRSSTSVYYAASAGLEEVRARLRSNNPNSFKNTAPANFLPTTGNPFPVCSPSYIVNPAGGETVAPWTSGSTSSSPYFDNEFVQELGGICGLGAPPSSSPNTPSIWNRSPLSSLAFPGPLFKWVRINGVSEQSLNIDTYPLYDGITSALIYYDGTNLTDQSGSGQVQVLEITALAVLPNGSQKLLQYLVAPAAVQLPPFLAALTISGSPGNHPLFHAPGTNASFAIKGNDQDCSGNPVAGSRFVAVGLFGDYSGNSYNSDLAGIVGGIPTNASGTNTQLNYTGLGPAPPTPNPPDVEYLTGYPTNLQTPAELEAIAQGIMQSADYILPSPNPPTYPLPTLTYSAISSLGMSATNPLTVVINGNLDVSNWTGTGYGLLLVRGTFTYDPSSSWNGIIMVIGQGNVSGNHLQYEQINGAMFVAKTLDPSGNLWTGRIGNGSVSFNDAMQGEGIRYSNCWIQKSLPMAGFKVLSFHEISQ